MSSANPQSDDIIREVRDLLAGRSINAQVADSPDRATRQMVAAQLLAAMSGPDVPGRERARQLFTNYGYLEETIGSLRTAESATERANHAQILGIVGSRLTTAHLVAALFDRSPEVCRSAAEALARIGDPAVALGPLNAVLSGGTDQEMATQHPEDWYEAELDLLRREEEELDQAAAAIALRRVEVENARQAEAERMRVEAEDRHRAEQEELREQGELLRRATDLVVRRRLELETARQQAEEEALQLEEVLQRMKAAEETGRHVAEQRVRLDAEAQRRVEEERRLLENARHRFAQEQQRLEQEASRRATEEEGRLAEFEAVRARMEIEAQEGAQREQQIRHEIEELMRAEAEQRSRIQEAEVRLRAAAESYAETYRRAETESRIRAEEKLEQEDHRRAEKEKAEAEVKASWGEREKARRPPHIPEVQEPSPPLEYDALIPAGAKLIPITIDSDSSDITPANLAGLDSLDAVQRAEALAELAWSGAESAFSLITKFLDDVSPDVRSVAARLLYELAPQRCVETFSRTLEEGSPVQWRNIGEALIASGLADRTIEQLVGDNREDTYNALCLLFVLAKTGEVQPLVRAIEEHHNIEVRRAAIRLLTLNGQSEIATAAAKRRLMVRR